MLNENIKAGRKSKGLSQEEFAVRLNVVRQTVSKWERGLSVPDSDMLISISEVLDIPVSVLLGGTVAETEPEDIKVIAEKLEVINAQLAGQKEARRKTINSIFILICLIIAVILIGLFFAGSPYLEWDYSDPEMSVAGTILHGLEFVFVRAAPVVFIASAIGAFMTRKRG
ncbi:MAG: helix-turn-helix domain-containing protein [Clostridiales bacterium]|nr:helix-turn-helix domain-containing protein [Clostridiales bacterium]